jgi:hypothetical protein
MWMGDAVVASLLDQIGLEIGDVHVRVCVRVHVRVTANMSFLNSSVVVPIKSLDRLHGAWNPEDAEEFRILCDSFGRLHGCISIRYAPCSSDPTEHSYECRQQTGLAGTRRGSGTNESVNCIYIYISLDMDGTSIATATTGDWWNCCSLVGASW